MHTQHYINNTYTTLHNITLTTHTQHYINNAYTTLY